MPKTKNWEIILWDDKGNIIERKFVNNLTEEDAKKEGVNFSKNHPENKKIKKTEVNPYE